MVSLTHSDVERWLHRVCAQIQIPQVRIEYCPLEETTFPPEQSPLPDPGLPLNRWGRSVEKNDPRIVWKTPIQQGNQPLGHLQVRLTEEHALSLQSIRACALADSLSRMVRQYSHLKQSFEKFRQDHGIRRRPVDENPVNSMVEETLQAVIKLSSYRGVAFFLLDPTGVQLRLKHYLHQALQPIEHPERDLLTAEYDREALLQGLTVCRRLSGEDANWLPADIRTGVCVRVSNQLGAIGTLWVYDRRARSTDDRDLHIVQSVACQLGTIFDHLLTSQETLSHSRLKIELRLAATIQPPQTISYRSPNGQVEAYGRCLSQFEIGGDFCELIPLNSRFLFLIIGDAAGNSIPAAMVMTALRGACYTLLEEWAKPTTFQRFPQTNEENSPPQMETEAEPPFKPADFMRQLNQMLTRLTGGQQFMSCLCGLFDLQAGTFTFCNAGHPAPIHLTGTKTHYLPSHGLLLGIDSQVEYRQTEIPYHSQDVLVFYTDGISEALSQTHRLFRQDGIAAAAQSQRQEPAEQIAQAVWDQVHQHQEHEILEDDASLLVIKFA